jgi:hypothetical protein
MTATAQRHARLPRGPFSRPLNVKSVPAEGLDMRIEASAPECAQVAADTDLPALASLSAKFRVERRAGGRLAVSGKVSADIVQQCVVTLEPFDSHIEQPVELTFAPAPSEMTELRGRENRRSRAPLDEAQAQSSTGSSNDDQADPPDPIIDDTIDLGAVAVEFLTLARDPYPRKPGVHFDDMAVGEAGESEPSAFAALERLKDRS